LWKNPSRAINRALFSACGHVGLWLFSLYFISNNGLTSVSWFRISAILLVAMPAHAWLTREVIMMGEAGRSGRVWRCRGWLAFAGAMTIWISLGNLDSLNRGLLVLCGVAAVLFTALTVAGMQGVHGVRRMELQIFLLGCVLGSAVALTLIQAGAWMEEPVLLEMMPMFVAALCAGTTWALTSTGVQEARRLLAEVLERSVLVGTVVVFVWSVQQLAQQYMHVGTAYVLSLSAGLWFAATLYPLLRVVFRQKSRLTKLRQAAFEVTERELRPEAMEDAFVAVLKEKTQVDRVAIMMRSQCRIVGGGLDIPADASAIKAVHALRWVTPERLEREKNIVGREVLQTFLSEHQFAVVVANAGPTLSFVLGLGSPITQRPFTHPEIARLMDVATTIENALSRARYLKQAQHAEQLATVGLLGASIAHEIRNPLVSIKAFVQLLPDHYQDAAFREKFFRLIGDEAGRIDRLTEQLMDLASPRVFASSKVAVHALLGSCLDLVSAKADDKGVKLITDLHAAPDVVQTDPNALKQVILNLSFNAIQALEQNEGQRWIRFETTKSIDRVELVITDSGPGISHEVWSRLFQPFQSTKSSGFGLGLAICKDILSSVRASISADPPVTGRGATFRISLPCLPPTS
jgi:signal transduction histidine kinase